MASFAPAGAGSSSTVSLAATQTSGNVQLSGVATGQSQCEIQNKDTANWAYVAFGKDNTVTATVPNGATGGSYAVGPGQSKIVTVGTNALFAAAICDSGKTATLFFTVGYGDS
jgi:hypothetical protein